MSHSAHCSSPSQSQDYCEYSVDIKLDLLAYKKIHSVDSQYGGGGGGGEHANWATIPLIYI